MVYLSTWLSPLNILWMTCVQNFVDLIHQTLVVGKLLRALTLLGSWLSLTVFPARIFSRSTGRLEIDTACKYRKPFSMFWATYPPNQLFTMALPTTQPSLYTSLLQRTACPFSKLATQPSGPPRRPAYYLLSRTQLGFASCAETLRF